MLAEIYLKSIKLNPADLIILNEPGYIDTILGSCVAITIYHRKPLFSLMCHAMLPRCRSNNRRIRNCDEERFKYVDTSIEYINEKLKDLFIKKENVEVKVFGGADVLSSLSDKKEISIGKMNVQTAFELLNQYGYNIVSYDVGGNFGRRIIFNTQNGEVLVKKLRGFPDYQEWMQSSMAISGY